MSRFPFLASLNSLPDFHSRIGNPEVLRNTILQSAVSYRFDGWNKGNFLTALRSRDQGRYCILALELEETTRKEINVYLHSRERLLLRELLEQLDQRKYPLRILFLYCAPELVPRIRRLLEERDTRRTLAVIAENDDHLFLFALGCELVNWWGLSSSMYHHVTFRHVAECVARTVRNYGACDEATQFVADIWFDPPPDESIAWAGGSLHATGADVEKLRLGAIQEEIDDTLKRILDCASHPREEHLSTGERLISSQGLFWLAESGDINDLPKWLGDTRLYSEVAPEAYHHDFGPSIRRRCVISQEVLLHIPDLFIDIPAQTYIFGANDTIIDSEPPAAAIAAYVPAFGIMRHPVTAGLWNAVIESPHAENSDDVPVTGINYFKARQFAELLNDIVREHDPKAWIGRRITLPTEYQWEAAARGADGRDYPWGNFFDPTRCNCEMLVGRPTPPGTYSPSGDSPFGCQDMAGNVREWTRSYGGTRGVDWVHHSAANVASDREILPMSRVVIRGGSYSYDAECVQTWVRNTQVALRRDFQTGFRLVCEVTNE